jgi:Ring finger domain
MQREWDINDVVLLAQRRADRRTNQPDVTDLSVDTQTATAVSGLQSNLLKRPRSDITQSKPTAPAAPPAPAAEASECSICLENYTSGGEKRCVVTKCGHIFCFSCIHTVIESRQPCPKCRKKLGKSSHLYTIYDTTVTAVDASQVDEARRMEADERAKRIEVMLRLLVTFCEHLILRS